MTTLKVNRRRLGRFSSLGRGPLPWLLPSIVVLIVVSVYPLAFAVLNSFRFYNLGVAPEPKGFLGFDNYASAFSNSAFTQSIGQTLLFCSAVTVIELILGIALALVLRERLRGVSVARSILIMPVAIAPTVAGLAFRSMYTNGTGLIPELAQRLGIALPPEGLLGSTATALPALMLTDIWQWTPFVALIALAALQGVPEDVVEAARLDGAGALRILRSITFPLVGATIATVAVLRFIQSFNVFDIIYAETRGGPGGARRPSACRSFLGPHELQHWVFIGAHRDRDTDRQYVHRDLLRPC